LCVLISVGNCQAPNSNAPDTQAPGTPGSGGAAVGEASAATPAKPDDAKPDDVGGLPTFLLKVPGGDVLVGMEVDAFVEACSQAAYSFNPKDAYKAAAEKFIATMRRSSSMLGRRPVAVPEFYLGKWPVKNSEYAV